MKIVCLVKQVPNTAEIKIDKETNTLIRDGVENIINPDDLAGVEEALKLKERYGGTVTTVTMGPKLAVDMLEELYAMGVDKAVLLTDRAFAGSDTLATSTILSSYLKTIEFDLIIAGYQAIDGDTAQVGPQVAELLKIPQATYLQKIIEVKDGRLIVEKKYETYFETLAVKLPCLVTTLADMNEPRLCNAWDIWSLDQKEIAYISFDDLDLNKDNIGLAGSPTKVRKTFPRPVLERSPIEELSPEEAADKILAKIYPYIEVIKWKEMS